MNDLSLPLGLPKFAGNRYRRIFVLFLSILTVALAAALGVWFIAVDDPYGGEPMAVAAIENGEGSIDRDEVTVVGVKSGSGQLLPEIEGLVVSTYEPGMAPPPGAAIGESGQRNGGMAAVTGQGGPAGVTDLIEIGPHGPIPRISDSGVRPLDAYAQPVKDLIGASPKIALIIGGLGLSQTSTQEALRLFRPEVTLAFAPYGNSLDRWSNEARRNGHEILLQIPLEPFDYPNNDPGPHTLTTSAGPEKNLNNLRWLMARLSHYVGVMSYMGARFTADDAALSPLMKELTGRGLMFVDENSSSRTQAGMIAAAQQTPFVRVDLVIDQIASKDDIISHLGQLEEIARKRGLAVGAASALPLSIREIAHWASDLEARGISLIPVTAALTRISATDPETPEATQ